MPVCKRMKNMQLDDSQDMDDEDSSEDEEYRNYTQFVSRAEKSRCAAKKRRDKEGIEMERLSNSLPFSEETISKLDKGAVIRLAIAYIRMKHYAQKDMDNSTDTSMVPVIKKERKCVDDIFTNDKTCSVGEEGNLMLAALNGFLIFISKKQKKVYFVSDNVEEFIGLTQANMIGKTVRDFIHPNDHKELDNHFVIQPTHKAKDAKERQSPEPMEMDVDSEDTLCQDHKRVFYLKMKFHMMKKGTKTRHSGYTLVQWSGRLKLRASSKPQGYSIDGLLCICRPMQSNSILEIRMDGNMFMSRHELDMRFTFCDPRIITLIGYEPGDLIGKTAYQFHNPLDAKKVHNCHSNLIIKGTSVSKYYRFLGKSGDWVWMQTRATIIYNTGNSPQYLVCMNYVIGEEEGQRYLMMETEQAGLQLPNIRGSIELNCCSKALMSCDNCCGNNGHISDHSDGGYGSSYSPYSSSSSRSNPSPVSIETKDCSGSDINAQEAVCHVHPNTPNFSCLSDTNCLINTLEVSSDFATSTETVKIEMAKEDEETLDEILGSFSEEEMVTTQSNTMVRNIPTNFSISQSIEDHSKPDENKPSLLRLLLNPKEDTVMTHPSCLPAMAAISSTFNVPASSVTNTVNMSAMDLDSVGANTDMRIGNVNMEGSRRFGLDPLVSSHVPFPRTLVPTRTPNSQNILASQINEVNLAENSAKPVVPAISTALPDDLVDLAINFYDSLADDQAQAVMAELGQDVWMGDIGDFGEETVQGLEKNFINGNMASEQQINMLFPDIPASFISNNPPFVCNSLGQSVLSDCNLGHTVNSNCLDYQQVPSKITQNNFNFGQLKHQNSRASSCSSSPTSSNTHSTSCLSPQYNFDSSCSSASHSPPLNMNLLQDHVIQEDQSMTELEKHLRGYIPPNLSTKESNDTVYQALNNFSVTKQHDVNDSKPLLQKFLTGELSKELYDAMERQRYLRDRTTPVFTSQTNIHH